MLAPGGDVGNENVGQVIAQQRAGEGDADLHHQRPMEMGDDEEIEQRHREDDRRHHEAEEHEGDQRRLAAEAGLGQLVAAVLGLQQIGELEAVQGGLHQVGGFDPQRAALLVQRRVMAGAQFLAPRRHRFEPVAETVARDQGQAQSDNGGEREDRRRQRWRGRSCRKNIEDADIEHNRPQSLKLIILRITMMPVPIQNRQAASIRLPMRSVKRSLM